MKRWLKRVVLILIFIVCAVGAAYAGFQKARTDAHIEQIFHGFDAFGLTLEEQSNHYGDETTLTPHSMLTLQKFRSLPEVSVRFNAAPRLTPLQQFDRTHPKEVERYYEKLFQDDLFDEAITTVDEQLDRLVEEDELIAFDVPRITTFTLIFHDYDAKETLRFLKKRFGAPFFEVPEDRLALWRTEEGHIVFLLDTIAEAVIAPADYEPYIVPSP